MNILFKPIFVNRILSGEKVVTRRTSEKWGKVRPGDIFLARTSYRAKHFATLRILSVTRELKPALGPDMHEADLEGCDTWRHFADIYAFINGEKSLEEPCYRIEFEVTK